MSGKKILKAVLFPPWWLVVIFVLFSAGGMLYGTLWLGQSHPVTIAAYAVSFYTLVICCVRVPAMIQFCKNVKADNRYLARWFSDAHLRMNITVGGSMLWNGSYGALQLGMGLYHRSAWFYSLAAYYVSLAVMRFCLVRHTLRHKPGEHLRQELRYYRICGWVFLVMNLALSGMMLYMIRENLATRHNEITTIAMAAYTFGTLTKAIINVPRYRKYNSPAMSAARVVSLASACVSMLTLENTMLTTFGNEQMTPQVRQLFLALSGGAISLIIVVMAIVMICRANRELKRMETSYGQE